MDADDAHKGSYREALARPESRLESLVLRPADTRGVDAIIMSNLNFDTLYSISVLLPGLMMVLIILPFFRDLF